MENNYFTTYKFENYDVEGLKLEINFVNADDELLLNYSINAYAGYPVYSAEHFDSFDEVSPILGLSVGTPIGIKAGLAYLTLNFEFINYKFKPGWNNYVIEAAAACDKGARGESR